jgi:hypothetical protein
MHAIEDLQWADLASVLFGGTMVDLPFLVVAILRTAEARSAWGSPALRVLASAGETTSYVLAYEGPGSVAGPRRPVRRASNAVAGEATARQRGPHPGSSAPPVGFATPGAGQACVDPPLTRRSVNVTRAREMLETYPRDFNVDVALLAGAIETLEACANTCTQCADACLLEQNVNELAKCIRLNLDCADLCEAASRVISRQTEYDANVTRPAIEACIRACRSCADECGRHADHMDHCRLCAEACRQCATACQQLLEAMA